MKKTLLTSLFIIFFSCTTCYGALIDNLENYIYGFSYPNQTETERLNRLEKSIYGQTSNLTNAQKLSKLKKDMSADLIGQEITPKEDTFMEDSDYIKEAVSDKIPQGSNIDYPVINEMEKQVFNQEFKTNDVNGRLSKLEQKVFGKTYNDDFSSRVDRLSEKLRPQTLAHNSYGSDDFYSYLDETDGKSYTHIPSYGSPDIDYDTYNNYHSYQSPSYNGTKSSGDIKLSAIEKKLFKKAYEGESISNRLARVESGMFGTVFSNESDSQRLERISSAYAAQKSAKKYDSNKLNQNIYTAIQIGTFILMVLSCIL